MRAVGELLTIEDVDLADPGPFEVVIRVAAAGLCHSDLRYLEGSYPLPVPAVLGHESAGVVEQVGDRVTHVTPGDQVITSLSVYCGSCHYCMRGQEYMCVDKAVTRRGRDQPSRLSIDGEPAHQFLDLASFAETMLVHEHAVVKITPEMPLDRAALLGCGVATGLGAVLNTAGVGRGETVAVIGCGGVGLSAIQGARIAGAGTIVAIDRVPGKLDLARRLGATHVVDAGSEDPVERVIALTRGLGVDHAFEAIGLAATAEQAFSMLRRGGTATVIGLIPGGQRVGVPADDLYYDRKLQGSVMGSNRFRITTPRYVEMYLDGRLNLDDMVTNRLDLSEINDGFAAMQSGRSARSIVVFDSAMQQ